MQTLNQSQFAKHLGVHKSYITELKQADRLVFAENGKVDVEASVLRIKETADPNRDDVTARHTEARQNKEKSDSKVDEIGAGKADKPNKKEKTVDADAASSSKGRALEQHFKALAAKLEYETSIGQVVPKVDMQAAVADVVTSFRQRLENLPHSIAAELVGKNQDEIHVLLKHACHEILSELSREFAAKIESREVAAV
jgi:hypothetical protein